MDEKGVGPIIGTVIVIVLLVMGAFYFIGQKVEKQSTTKTINPVATTSDEVSSLQDDVNSLNVDNLGNSVNNL